MPKNNTKGGKKQKKIKKQGDQERELQFKEPLQEYGQILRLLGDSRLEIQCIDGVRRIGHIRGKMRKKVWMTTGDIVLVALREYEKDKCDIILKYTQDEIMKLKQHKEIPDNLKVNEDSERKKDDGMIEFEKNVDNKDEDEEEDNDEIYMSDEEEESEEESEDEKEEKKDVKNNGKKEADSKKHVEETKKEESEEEDEEENTEDISNLQQNEDILSDFCKDAKKPSILSKTSHTVKTNIMTNKAVPQTNYNKQQPAQNYQAKSSQGGKKKFVEIDLKKI
jgi:translation initiation factor 1A